MSLTQSSTACCCCVRHTQCAGGTGKGQKKSAAPAARALMQEAPMLVSPERRKSMAMPTGVAPGMSSTSEGRKIFRNVRSRPLFAIPDSRKPTAIPNDTQ